jgi:amino acid adenylation domain-containing protein
MQSSAAVADGAARLFPLTPTQQGLLFHRFLDDQAGTDVQQLVCRWHEPLDVRALERAWQRLAEQHDVLRTTFRWEGLPEPKQEVHAAIAVPLERRDPGSLEAYLDEDRRRGFDLTRPPLFRVALFDRVLVWSFHHALLDTPSVRMLVDELLALYDALRDGRDVLLRARPPFRTFTEWLHGRDLKPAEAFWRERLRGFSAPTPLIPLPPEHETTATYQELTIELPLATGDLRTLLTAAWGVLLARTSGESDVVFGVAESRRENTVAGAESILGLFVNTIPARVRLSDSDTVAALLERVAREQEEARLHEHAPLASIQRWSDVKGGVGLFDSLLVFEEESAGAPLRGRAEVELRERTSYPLTLTAWLDSPALRLAWDPRRFDEAAVRRMAGHLRTLLTALPGALETPALRLPLLAEEERRQLLVEWNDTRADYPRDRFVHELFEARAVAHPERIALRFGDEALTYAELNRRADRIAHRLRSLGVGPDSFVGLLLERSTDMIAALLGILKAGGAYVPLDPSYPKDRLELMLEDSRAAVLLTQPSLAGLLETYGAHLLVLEEGWESDAGGAAGFSPPNGDGGLKPAAPLATENLAYVIYTSGSTGKPKGVQLPHRAVVNFLETMRREPGLTEDDVVIGLTTLSFDIAGLEIYLPLTTGAQLVLIGREVAADARRLSDVITRSGATVVQATPATWRMLLDAGWKGSSTLKLLCGGEALARDLADRLLERCGSLWNMYGPTETTIWSTVRRVTPGRSATVPIGKPIANTQVYVLDPALEPVPIGVPGELHIGGDGVARGYLNRPELTAERFIRNPFVEDPAARMYKTGDAVRWLPGGELEYLNRLDNQVKLRGYRIELGEIEAALRRHDGVADAVVTVRTDAPSGKALVAYWIAEGEPAPVGELKAFLKESLPEYMVPQFFVRLTELPLTPNGKVDRKALPAPERPVGEAAEASVAPRDEIEQRLARIWCDVLRLPSVGIHDNFFDLGGESLLAVQMFVRIETEFARELPLATLLQAGTIETLASRIREKGWDAPWSPLVPIQPNGTRRPLFWVHGVGGNVLNYRPLAMRLGQDQPFYGLQARGMDGKLAPLATIEEMAAVYLSEIRKVQSRGPYLIGGASFGGVVAYEMAQQLRDAGDAAAFVALLDTSAVATVDERKTKQSLWTRLQLHLGILLRGPDRWGYLKKKERRLRRKTVYRIWQTVFALFQKFNKPLPQALQDVAQNNYRALRIYKARPYDGRVGLFCARLEPEEFTEAKQRGWTLLVPSLEIYDVDGDHLTMVEEPHVPDLAGKLAAAFEAPGGS